MDKDGFIYLADDPAPEDVARLDGYLRGRAESDAERRAMIDKYEAEIAGFARALSRQEGAE